MVPHRGRQDRSPRPGRGPGPGRVQRAATLEVGAGGRGAAAAHGRTEGLQLASRRVLGAPEPERGAGQARSREQEVAGQEDRRLQGGTEGGRRQGRVPEPVRRLGARRVWYGSEGRGVHRGHVTKGIAVAMDGLGGGGGGGSRSWICFWTNMLGVRVRGGQEGRGRGGRGMQTGGGKAGVQEVTQGGGGGGGPGGGGG